MPKTLNLSRLKVQRVIGETDYSDNEILMESLRTIDAVWNIPICRYLRDLLDGKIDAISFTKDKPYYYFFGRRFEKDFSVTIKEEDKIIEFRIPIDKVEKLLTT